jgi:segregation and condensation protein B
MTAVDQVHALLFVADQPIGLSALANALELTEGQVEQALEILEKKLKKAGPIQVVRLAGGFQLSTKPEYAHMVSAFLKPQRSRLSRSLMEVLAIVAYRQPLTIAEIEVIRGVQSDHPIRSLLERRLIQEVGRKPTPGRPILYGTSAQFLHQFKMNDLKELPSLEAGLPDAEPRALESRLDEPLDESEA